MKVIVEQSTDPYHNLAREEAWMNHCRQDTVYLWRNRPSVIIGRHQNTLAEVDELAAEKEDISIVRRLTGGGAVYHDLGNINFSYIFPQGNPDSKKTRALQMVLRYLRHLGVDCFFSGRNDLCLENEGGEVKIGGTAMTQRGERGIFHGCILFDSDLSLMEEVLTPSREKLESKGISSIRARVANLKEQPALKDMTADDFFSGWIEFLQQYGAEIQTDESQEEKERIRLLEEERYRTAAWNFGRNPQTALISRYRFPVGTVELSVELAGSVIKDCRFSGDYISSADFEQMESLLRGSIFTDQAIRRVVSCINTEEYFGTDDCETVVNFIMGRRI